MIGVFDFKFLFWYLNTIKYNVLCNIIKYKYLYPCKEDGNSNNIVVINVPIGKKIEVWIFFSIF